MRQGRRIARSLTAAVVVAAAAIPPPAVAADKSKVDRCVDADTQAQVLRREKKLGEARKQLEVCVDAACPEVVRADCAQRMDELNGAQPTLVVDAKDERGADLLAVKVTVDGKPFTDKIDGSALPVDPGPHTFTFEVAGRPPVNRVVVIKEGEKNRRERVVLGSAAPPVGPSPAPGDRTREKVGLGLGGLGVVGLGVGAALGGLAMSRWSRAKSECSASICPDHAAAVRDHDATVALGNGSTAGFAVGGALLVTGVVLFVTGRRAAPAAGFAPILGPGIGGLAATGRF